MPSKIRDRDRDRDRDQDRDRDPNTPKSKERPRHRRSSRRRSSTKDSEKPSVTAERHSSHASLSARHSSAAPVPELDPPASTASPHGSRASLPYPSFSKAHSKEAVGSRENVVNPRLSYYTPDPTDLDPTKITNEGVEPDGTGGAPPSPPLTTVDQATAVGDNATSAAIIEKGRDEDSSPTDPAATSVKESRQRKSVRTVKAGTVKAGTSHKVERKRSDLQKAADEIKKRLQRRKSSSGSKAKSDRQSSARSRSSQRETSRDEEKSAEPTRRSRTSTPIKTKPKPATIEDMDSSTTSGRPSSPVDTSITETETETQSESTIDSDATSIAPNQPSIQEPSTPMMNGLPSPPTSSESPLRTPAPSEPNLPPTQKTTPALVTSDDHSLSGSFDGSPAPPPPPPPPAVPFQMPRVDYLIQNGGLSRTIPRNLLAAGAPIDALNVPLAAQVESFFAPFSRLLDDYTKVISRSGSLAVATGYRSIARRLLDRLEVVFARDISSEVCSCVICESTPFDSESIAASQGVSWGEILEYVCGRQELPLWPPFILDNAQAGLGLSKTENQAPMQHLDIDVPEEFRDHYIRQSKKTKQSVDRWLANQPDSPASPPQDVDDETLTFAMLTRLEADQRPIFSTLAGVAPSRPPSRASTPLMEPRSELLERTGLAIQRLYHLPGPPRDPESAMYLLTNPDLHNVLATLAAISDDEWDILTSGRFDGFLRSGAEDVSNPQPPSNQTSTQGLTPAAQKNPSMPPSRGTTPFSRGPTPSSATAGAPVAMDEETEIAVLAEI